MAGTMFRGTNVDQDPRWGRSDQRILAKMEKNGQFPPIFETKVDLKRVNLDIISKWITERLVQILGFDDEIVINLIINLLQNQKNLDPKRMQLDITGFLEKKSGAFMEELWTLLCDAQNQPTGIPAAFLQKKKEEILLRQAQQEILDVVSSSSKSRWGPPAGGNELIQEAPQESEQTGMNHDSHRNPDGNSNAQVEKRYRHRENGDNYRQTKRSRDRSPDRRIAQSTRKKINSNSREEDRVRRVSRSRSRDRVRKPSRRSPSSSSCSPSSRSYSHQRSCRR